MHLPKYSYLSSLHPQTTRNPMIINTFKNYYASILTNQSKVRAVTPILKSKVARSN